PVVMVTKSEEENIMNRAIGSKIADYLIKPVNPSQVLLSIKKNVHREQLVTEQSTSNYRTEFGQISASISGGGDFEQWVQIYRKIVGWDMELSESSDPSVGEILSYQKTEADNEFAKFIKNHYQDWFDEKSEKSTRPVMSHNLMRNNVFPQLSKDKKTTFLLIDNFRYDQWLMVRDLITPYYRVDKEDFYCASLPTATQYARNALFAGLTPLSISKLMPTLWLNDSDEGAKNAHEEEFLRRLMAQCGRSEKLFFEKLIRPESGKRLLENLDKVYNADLSVIVYNFLDILSHARTETEIIRELADDEAAFRSLTRSWFEHSELLELIRRLSTRGNSLIITSDHGTKRVEAPIRVVGDRETSTNLRYKSGRNLSFKAKEVFSIDNPEKIGLPKSNLTSNFIFATGGDFLVYPNNYNHFVRYYQNTFQHGGVSMEEMIVPIISLSAK
ncbi:MAG: PglZ domain-containing protein, partial [Mucinivorans sp.]